MLKFHYMVARGCMFAIAVIVISMLMLVGGRLFLSPISHAALQDGSTQACYVKTSP